MAKLFAFAVYDKAIEGFNRPMFVPAEGIAFRAFSDEVNRAASDNAMSQHPEDFSLYRIGFFDESSGALEGLDIPVRVAEATGVLIRPRSSFRQADPE